MTKRPLFTFGPQPAEDDDFDPLVGRNVSEDVLTSLTEGSDPLLGVASQPPADTGKPDPYADWFAIQPSAEGAPAPAAAPTPSTPVWTPFKVRQPTSAEQDDGAGLEEVGAEQGTLIEATENGASIETAALDRMDAGAPALEAEAVDDVDGSAALDEVADAPVATPEQIVKPSIAETEDASPSTPDSPEVSDQIESAESAAVEQAGGASADPTATDKPQMQAAHAVPATAPPATRLPWDDEPILGRRRDGSEPARRGWFSRTEPAASPEAADQPDLWAAVVAPRPMIPPEPAPGSDEQTLDAAGAAPADVTAEIPVTAEEEPEPAPETGDLAEPTSNDDTGSDFQAAQLDVLPAVDEWPDEAPDEAPASETPEPGPAAAVDDTHVAMEPEPPGPPVEDTGSITPEADAVVEATGAEPVAGDGLPEADALVEELAPVEPEPEAVPEPAAPEPAATEGPAPDRRMDNVVYAFQRLKAAVEETRPGVGGTAAMTTTAAIALSRKPAAVPTPEAVTETPAGPTDTDVPASPEDLQSRVDQPEAPPPAVEQPATALDASGEPEAAPVRRKRPPSQEQVAGRQRRSAAPGRKRKPVRKGKRTAPWIMFAGPLLLGFSIVLVGASLMAPLSPALQNVSLYFWYWTGLAVLAAGVWAMGRRWAMVVASLLVALIGLQTLVPAAGRGVSGQPSAHTVGWANLQGSQEALTAVLRQAADRNADLVILAELPQGFSAPPPGWSMIAQPIPGDRRGLAVLSKGNWRASVVPGEPTMAMPADQSVRVIAVNASPPSGVRRSDPERQAEINRAANRAGDFEGAILAVGDFGEPAWSRQMRQFVEYSQGQRIRCGGFLGITYSPLAGVVGWASDHAFMVNGQASRCAIGGGLPGSRHKPLWIGVAAAAPATAPAR